MKLRFGRAQKIKSRKEISRLFKCGRRWECDCFVLIFMQSEFDHDRFGVIVSKKIGNAVERNRVKRIFREVYRCNIKNSPPFFDILIKPKNKDVCSKWNINEQREFFEKWMIEAGKS